MATNQGLLQAQIKVKNTIDLNNAFSSPSVANPQLKSIEGELNLSNEYALQSFNSFNTNTQHIDTIRTNSSNTSLKEALNNLPNLQYVRLEGSYESKGNSFDNNTNLQKVDLSESLQVKPEDFKANENLKTLPNLDYSNPDLTDIITNDTNLLPTTFDISNEPNTNKLGIHGDSTHQLGNLEFVKVNPEAPFDNQITPQINVSYTSLDRNGLVNLFNTMPYNVGYQIIGNPTIVDGVVSGFSWDDYLRITNSPLATASSFEMKMAVEDIGASGGGLKTLVRFGTRNSIEYTNGGGLWWEYVANKNIVFWGGFPTTGKFYIKAKKEGNLLELGVSSNDITYNTRTAVCEDDMSFLEYINFFASRWNGTSVKLNLNETYIKVNSIVSTGPVGYTVVGNPTIENGIVSGFSGSKYLQTNSSVPSGTSFSVNTKIRTSTNTTAYRYIIGSKETRGFSLKQGSSRKIGLQVGNDGSSYHLQIEGTTLLSAETDYFVKVEYDGTSFKLYLGTSETNLNLEASGNYTTTSAITFRFGQGWSTSSGFGFGGSIDLNNTYIKVNGKLWFGHESKQVTWFNGKPSQMKVVDVSGATGTSSLTNDDKAIITNKGWRLVTDGSNSKNYTIEDGKLTWANPNIYLQSTGTQYIDTGIVPTATTGFILEAAKVGAFQDNNMFGSRKSSGVTTDLLGILTEAQTKGNRIMLCNAGIDYGSLFILFDNNYHNYSVLGDTLKIDNSTFTHAPSSYSTNDLPMYLFGLNNRGTAQLSAQKVKRLEIYNNGQLIKQFVPVPIGLQIGSYTVLSNGMFDIVNQQFYPNAGTGEFTYGWDLE